MSYFPAKLVALLILALCAGGGISLAKRVAPAEVPPVRYGIFEIRAPNSGEAIGKVEVWNTKTHSFIQHLTIYRVFYSPFVEQDTQWNFIKEARVDGHKLVTVDEKGKTRKTNLKRALRKVIRDMPDY